MAFISRNGSPKGLPCWVLYTTSTRNPPGCLTGNARIAVEIEVAVILARSNDRVGERGGSRREQEWQESRSRAKHAEATDAAATRAGTGSIVWDILVISGLAFVE